ncbi:MAG: hypothetical protein A2504_09255 [Bdellovibrionales bacterium RIFOXYD12_FULL_39_22]|nr:MAG: hypothetical protein A2385_17295 [Bdellovibrionales bacterium RIFOXYB1_FULL_39_21]OFZ41072.1 MAG: hypothetical protein A2485_00220 [Bdellovibrionales bacterium RIFOXYC12_FULL_39_17]OFZ50285.1 MAG: hypothetical protein A2404_07535 [Bdellovibrionales bacterium RIFOXYC1_FULL_39_130]OFZ71050.1 MAG: hypothetical protein A2451_16085 [Bdellovibrionales bacterium RIFOXYC2_FULL_39_8]OFZ75086.1 MAG: hypothetical protein A2560_16230 [Bdellovibrionales bacterium RIFOXYD1_FULL_39_84]OFZ92272.1 MAG:
MQLPEKLQALAREHNLEVVEQPAGFSWYLHEQSGTLSLVCIGNKTPKRPLHLLIDLWKKWQYHQSMRYVLSREPFAKALGLHRASGKEMKILDATCGVADDSILMLAMGASVVAFERSFILHILIEDAIGRASEVDPQLKDIFKSRFTLFGGDCRIYNKKSDVIYLDPMYPEKKKNSLPKKEMQILRELLGPVDHYDAENLFEWALQHATSRVVVKRSLAAPTLGKRPPDIVFAGKSTRYDVYLTPTHFEPSGEKL